MTEQQKQPPIYLNTILLFVIVVIIGFTFFYALKEIRNIDEQGIACLENPLVYGAKQLEMLNEGEASCSCNVGGGIMMFNSKEINQDKKVTFDFNYE